MPESFPPLTPPSEAAPLVSMQEEALPPEDVGPQQSDVGTNEPPRRKWTRKEWRDNIIATVAFILILAGALFATWYFYAR